MFQGFPEETIRFFLDLRFHNEVPWFHAHREEYEAYVRKPFKEFIEAMGPYVLQIADDIDTRIKISRAAEYIMKNLNQREREIIILRYGLGSAPAKTQREVADKLGISSSYVSHRHYCKQVQPTGTGIPHRLYLFCCYDKSEHTFIFEIVIAFLRSHQKYILLSTCLHPP